MTSSDDLYSQTVHLLTAAARRTRVVGAGTDGEHREPADFAAFLTEVMAATAANVGGVEALLAGRSGSWEADYVRQMVRSTVGADEFELWRYRTEPVRVPVHVGDLLQDIGVEALYDEAYVELGRRVQSIFYPSAGIEPMARSEQEAAAAKIGELEDALDEQQTREWAAYGAAFREQVLLAAAEIYPGLPVDVRVTMEGDPEDGGPSEPEDADDSPEYRLWEVARLSTPLPGGIPLADYGGGSVADVDRAAGRTPLARLAEVGE